MRKLNNCNLVLHGFGHDLNGNGIIRLSFGNKRSFLIQTNGDLPETCSLRTTDISKLSDADLDVIGQECSQFILECGTQSQQNQLKQS